MIHLLESTVVESSWPRDLPVVHAVVLPDAPRRIAGIQVVSAREYMGLHAWDDAVEGVDDDIPFVVFDLEKALRMLLRQSPLALLVFASPRVFSTHFSAETITEVLGHALSAQMVDAMCDYARSAQSDWARTGDRARGSEALAWMLRALALAESGGVGFDTDVLAAHLDEQIDTAAIDSEISRLEARLRSTENVLPAAPTGYNDLSDWLITQRLETL